MSSPPRLLTSSSQDPTFSGSLAALVPRGVRLAGVPTDAGGLVPSKLAALLRGWGCDAATTGVPRPRVLYTIPTGGNPTGVSLSAARREELYAVAQEFDLFILEVAASLCLPVPPCAPPCLPVPPHTSSVFLCLSSSRYPPFCYTVAL